MLTVSTLTAHMSALPRYLRVIVFEVAKMQTPTLTACRQAINAIPRADRPGITVNDGGRLVLEHAEAIHAARYKRRALRQRSTGKRDRRANERAALARRLSLPIAERTRDRSEAGIRAAAERVLHTRGSGGTTWDIVAGDAPASYVETPRRYVEWKHNRPHAKVADDHVVRIPARWWLRVARIGDGTGVVCGRLVLDATRLVGTVNGDRAIYSAVLVRPGRGYTAVTEQAFLSCWGDIITIKTSFAAATAERPPQAVVLRDAAIAKAAMDARAEELRLADLDERALADLEI